MSITGPFSMNRRIAWGECDPARIYYTPRVADYAAEAVESWCEKQLGSRAALGKAWGLDLPFRRIACIYLRPLSASQSVRLDLRLTGVGRSDLFFRVQGEDEEGNACFRSELAARCVDRQSGCPAPLPPDLLRLVEECRGHAPPGDEGGTIVREDSERDWVAPPGGLFTRARRVGYGDCDPSGTVHPPRLFDFAVEAIGEWYEEVPGISWMELVCRRNQGAPFVSAACEVRRPPQPGEEVTLAVGVSRLGGASLGFSVWGTVAGGAACFRADLDACFIDRKAFRAMRIPDEFRRPIETYIRASAAGAGKQSLAG